VELDTPPAPPPVRRPPWPRPVPGFAETYAKQISLFRRAKDDIDYINPPYAIQNTDILTLSNKTVATDVVHYNGLREYDTHNLYGTCRLSTSLSARS
jgi:alpha-glucosidase